MSKKQIILYNNPIKELDIRLEDYLVPTKTLLPDWWLSINPSQKVDNNTKSNIRRCPSFLELFHKTYTLISPCDMELEISRFGFKANMRDNNWFNLGTHSSYIEGESQFGDKWDKDLVNIKFSPPISLSPKNKVTRFTYMPCFYHNPRPDLIVAPGTFELAPGMSLELNINTFVDFKGFPKTHVKNIEVKSGDPLATLMISDDMVKFEKAEIKRRPEKKLVGNHLSELKNHKPKQCPFSRLWKN